MFCSENSTVYQERGPVAPGASSLPQHLHNSSQGQGLWESLYMANMMNAPGLENRGEGVPALPQPREVKWLSLATVGRVLPIPLGDTDQSTFPCLCRGDGCMSNKGVYADSETLAAGQSGTAPCTDFESPTNSLPPPCTAGIDHCVQYFHAHHGSLLRLSDVCILMGSVTRSHFAGNNLK